MASAALSEDSYYDVSTVSSRVRSILVNSFDAVTRDFVIAGANDGEYGFKAGAQVAFLQRVMGLVVGKEAVGKDEVARALADEARAALAAQPSTSKHLRVAAPGGRRCGRIKGSSRATQLRADAP